ncbi:hypothetical protein D9M72_603890 [compost metagenome]
MHNDKPRPVPRSRFCSGVSTCTKSSNRVGSRSCGMPMPVSRTLKHTECASTSLADTTTWPLGVNLSALEMKLRRICASFLSSV